MNYVLKTWLLYINIMVILPTSLMANTGIWPIKLTMTIYWEGLKTSKIFWDDLLNNHMSKQGIETYCKGDQSGTLQEIPQLNYSL